jgi:TonB family protein
MPRVKTELLMILPLIVLSAEAPAAPPPPTQGIVAWTDYPQGALDRNEQGSVYFEVIVSPEGRVDSCKILISSRYKDLDEAACRIVTVRARFAPAKDEGGRSIYGAYRQVINWRINSAGSPPIIGPDFDLTINQAPEGMKLPVQFAVHYLVKANGAASRCEFSNDWAPKSPIVPPPTLVHLACDVAMQPPIRIVRNHKDEPVDASDGATVRFSVKP